MNIQKFNGNTYRQNVYLYYGQTHGVVIDAGCDTDAAEMAAFARERGIQVVGILLTHGHFDHLAGLAALKTHFPAPVYAHQAEAALLADPALNLSCRVAPTLSVTADHLVSDGDAIPVGDATLQVLHTPGHTAGGCCFYDAAHGILFSGDTLFRRTVGRTDLPTSHPPALETSLAQLRALPGNVVVYPGHGRSTTLAEEQ